MRRLLMGGLALTVLMLILAAAGVGRREPDFLILPTERSSNVFFARATINGDGPFWLTVDTGATLTVLDPSAARRLGLDVRDSAASAHVGVASEATRLATASGVTIRLGDAPPFTPAPIYVLPVRAAASALGHHIDGILGADFLQGFVVDFDYRHDVVRLFRPARPPLMPAAPVFVGFTGNVLTATAMVHLTREEEVATRLLVDTGSSSGVSLNTPFVRRHRLEDRSDSGPGRRGLELSVAIGVNGVTSRGVLPIAGVRVGGTDLRVPKIALSREAVGLSASTDFDGILGAAVLSAFRVVIDFPNQRLWLER
jgi:predicted aspartyl protease